MARRRQVVKDLTGQRFGRLTCLSYTPGCRASGVKAKWRCQCDCGREAFVYAGNLPGQKSCGCWRVDNCRAHAKALNASDHPPRLKHGHLRDGQKHPLYSRWAQMWRRCTKPQDQKYPLYGARGIGVCSRWRDFALFLADVGMPPSPQHQMDRIDNDGNYQPENFRWATPKQQANNRRPARTR